MNNDLFLFKQFVSEKGHRIITPKKCWDGGFFEIDKNTEPEESIVPIELNGYYDVKRSNEISETLFITFSQLEKNHESILDFANTHGMIGVNKSATSDEYKTNGSAANPVYTNEKTNESHYVLLVEPISGWYNHIEKLARCVELWQLYSSNDIEAVRQLIQWDDYSEDFARVRYLKEEASNSLRYGSLIYATNYYPHLLEHGPHGSIDLPVHIFIQDEVNSIYKEHVKTVFALSGGYKKLVHQIKPKNLLGLMWVQFARAFEGKKPYRNCKLCGTPFLTESERGKKKLFCSDACKSKNYRLNKTS